MSENLKMNNEKCDFLDESLKGCYGSRLKPSAVKKWLVDNILGNIDREVRITLNIMGCAGTSKTSLVKSLANTPVEWNGKEYDGFKIVDIPLSQIEEMGDILGFPVEEIKMKTKDGEDVWIKAVDSLIRSCLDAGYTTDGEQRTIYAPPSWVPKDECPGVLLFDDGNRASQRILKGIMQLIQDYRTISWSIPRGWTIVLTGNPDNRMNQVTSMDTAQLSRMKFVTLVPDAKEWALWAEQNGIDGRLISFVMKYPEMMIGPERTNPRTLAEFGRALRRFSSVGSDSPDWLTEAYASLDDCTVEALMVFLQSADVGLVIEPDEILLDYDLVKDKVKKLMHDYKEPRIDIINIINTRLYARITSKDYVFDKKHVPNFQAWLLDKNIPHEISYALARRIGSSGNKYSSAWLSNKDVLAMVRLAFEADKVY